MTKIRFFFENDIIHEESTSGESTSAETASQYVNGDRVTIDGNRYVISNKDHNTDAGTVDVYLTLN